MAITNRKGLDRRSFLKLSASAAGVTLLSACAPAIAPTVVPAGGAGTAAGSAISGATLTFLDYPWFVPKMNEILVDFENEWAAKNGVNFNLSMTTSADIQAKLATAIETKQGANLVISPSHPRQS